jgi:COP9 signalosome complex subunit 1
MDLAEHYYKCGDYDNALKCYTRIRDYCTSPKHLLDQCLDAINVGFQMRNYSTVQAYISKAQNAPDGSDKDAIASKLKATAAVHSLVTGKYAAAAADFLQVGPDLGSTYNEVFTSLYLSNPQVLSANDIAVYGGLCALAAFDREDLKTRLLDNTDFKSYLELEPHIREAAQSFYSARYSVTLDILDRHRPDFIVDIFLSSHVDTLYKEIRQKALVQAFNPYSTLELATLSSLFSTPVPDLAVEMVQLIEHGKIKARLDSQKNVLVTECLF